MKKLEKALIRLDSLERGAGEAQKISPVFSLIVTLIYLIIMLSVSLYDLQRLILYAIFPLIGVQLYGVSIKRIFKDSLYILPFIAIIGIFNPIMLPEPAFKAGNIVVTKGWILFISILLRGLLALQAVLIIVSAYGFTQICAAMRKIGVPGFLVTQLQFVYRYLGVLLSQTLDMNRAAHSRAYGNSNFPLKIWGAMIGQLLLRTIHRAEWIHKAMLSRGFTGTLPVYKQSGTKYNITSGVIWTGIWTIVLLGLRIVNLSTLFQIFKL